MEAPVVLDKPWSVIVGGGGVNLYFYRLGTTANVFSMEDIDISWSWRKQEGCISQNFIYPWFELRALAPLQIPVSLYDRTMFLILCWVITFLKKRQI